MIIKGIEMTIEDTHRIGEMTYMALITAIRSSYYTHYGETWAISRAVLMTNMVISSHRGFIQFSSHKLSHNSRHIRTGRGHLCRPHTETTNNPTNTSDCKYYIVPFFMG